jgi:NADPH-dependent 2,4-dienoyl-CoA reductase/sulfur reductase-like enzyme
MGEKNVMLVTVLMPYGFIYVISFYKLKSMVLMHAHRSCLIPGFFTHIDGQNRSPPSVIVIGGGISGIAAARALSNASFKVNF